MKEELLKIYNSTTYLVPSLDLEIRPGIQNSRLNEVLAHYGVNTFSFITAYNPNGIETLGRLNREAHNRLIVEVSRLGIQYVEGYGRGSNGWKEEISLLILGISLVESGILSQKFKQKAFVFGQINEAPSIIWSEPD